MSHGTEESLPSLACPLIANPAEDVESEKTGLSCRLHHFPPFPAIDFNKWDGFTLPHLHWVGFKTDKTPIPDFQARVAQAMAKYHESCHQSLALSPFSVIKNFQVIELYGVIEETFNNTKEKIPVPLSHKLSRNKIEKQWRIAVHLNRTSQLVEEVFAVRSSLLIVHRNGFITDHQLQRSSRKYKRAYGRFISGYAETYNAFDFVAGEVGSVSALSMVLNALSTLHPNTAFNDLLYSMCTIDQTATKGYILEPHVKKYIEFIANGSEEDACKYFAHYLSAIDPDDSHYSRKDIEYHSKMTKKRASILSEIIDDDILKFILSSPESTLFSGYSRFLHSLNKAAILNLMDLHEDGVIVEKVEEGNYTIFLESILQQLTQGVGLVCPFWGWKASAPCCGGRNRDLLGKVWKYTKPEEPCTFSAFAAGGRLWMPLGCLKEKESSSC